MGYVRIRGLHLWEPIWAGCGPSISYWWKGFCGPEEASDPDRNKDIGSSFPQNFCCKDLEPLFWAVQTNLWDSIVVRTGTQTLEVIPHGLKTCGTVGKSQALCTLSFRICLLSTSFLLSDLDPVFYPHPIQFSCSVMSDSLRPHEPSMPGFPIHHQLLESTQTHIHWVGDAIQPSHPLLSPSLPALNLSQHQGLFKWVSSLHQVAKVLEFQPQHQSFQWTPRTDLL